MTSNKGSSPEPFLFDQNPTNTTSLNFTKENALKQKFN